MQAVARAVAYLHEIGLSLSYKRASRHSRYLLKHSNLPGFSVQEREALLKILEGVGGIIDEDSAPDTLQKGELALLTRILRIAVLLCQRRNNDRIPQIQAKLQGECIVLQLPSRFFTENRYLASLLIEEQQFQKDFGGLSLQEG